MKKLINDPADYVNEVVDGLCAAHPETFSVGGENARMAHGATPGEGRVGVVSGGGFGHGPDAGREGARGGGWRRPWNDQFQGPMVLDHRPRQ